MIWMHSNSFQTLISFIAPVAKMQRSSFKVVRQLIYEVCAFEIECYFEYEYIDFYDSFFEWLAELALKH